MEGRGSENSKFTGQWKGKELGEQVPQVPWNQVLMETVCVKQNTALCSQDVQY